MGLFNTVKKTLFNTSDLNGKMVPDLAYNSELNMRGPYDAADDYAVSDLVFFDDMTYVCRLQTTGHAPTETEYWLPISAAQPVSIPIIAGTGISVTESASSIVISAGFGVQGKTGPMPNGPQGMQGNAGMYSPQGSQGPAGVQGMTGYQGSLGSQGAQGYTASTDYAQPAEMLKEPGLNAEFKTLLTEKLMQIVAAAVADNWMSYTVRRSSTSREFVFYTPTDEERFRVGELDVLTAMTNNALVPMTALRWSTLAPPVAPVPAPYEPIELDVFELRSW